MASRIRPFPIVGHRGAPQLAPPGNTLSSLRRAIEVGAQMLEVDVRETKDRVLVLDHEAVRLVGGREVPIRERTYAQWREEAADTNAPLSTLEEAFQLTSQTGVGLMIDFKEPGTEALLARAIRRSKFPLADLLVAGANDTSRGILRSLDPNIPLSLTLESPDALRLNADLLATLNTDAVTWHHKLITPAVVKALHKRDILVYGWTVNLAEEMRRLRDDCGVDGIITDAPDLLRAL